MSRISVGAWRTGPMQVVSGPIGKETMHYQAPPAERLRKEMKVFPGWFADTSPMDPLLAAGLERNEYYRLLELTQKNGPDITTWMQWFLSCLYRAIEDADNSIGTVLQKARFWQRFAAESLNERQINVLNRLLDGGFEGKLTSDKWV